MSRRGQWRAVAVAVAALIAWLGSEHLGNESPGTEPVGSYPPGTAPEPPRARRAGSTSIENAFAARQSDLWVEADGTVTRTLGDDREGSRHQRFIIELASGHTVLIAHNIDLADRVPLRRGDRVGFRGEYEWNERGGVIHWTHHDPQNRHAGGWIEHAGRRYR